MAAAVMAITIAAHAAEPTARPQTVCPVRGGQINPQVHADYQGQRIFFCCGSCVKPFLANAAKLISKMAAEGIVLAATPAPSATAPAAEAAGDGCCASPAQAANPTQDAKSDSCGMHGQSSPSGCSRPATDGPRQTADVDRQQFVDYLKSFKP